MRRKRWAAHGCLLQAEKHEDGGGGEGRRVANMKNNSRNVRVAVQRIWGLEIKSEEETSERVVFISVIKPGAQ